MVYLIDANIIVRFLVGSDEQSQESREIIEEIHAGDVEVEILSEVLMEVIFIMTKYYKAETNDILNDLKTILLMQGVVNADKALLIEVLHTMRMFNIDYVDALICTKTTLQGYGKISFDKDVMKKCNKEI